MGGKQNTPDVEQKFNDTLKRMLKTPPDPKRRERQDKSEVDKSGGSDRRNELSE